MRKIFFLLIPVLFAFRSDNLADEGRVRTFLNGKIESWEVTIGNEAGTLEAYLRNDVNRWTFEVGKLSGEVNTEFNDNLGSWIITVNGKEYKMKTWISNSWHRWELTGGDITGKTNIQTLYANSWGNWQMTRDSVNTEIVTYFNDSWNDWNIRGNFAVMKEGEKVAAFFMPVFVSRIYKRGLVK